MGDFPGFAEFRRAWDLMTEEERARFRAAMLKEQRRNVGWRALPGPQTRALMSPADELFYGGSAGGGKGLALDTPLPTPSGWVSMGDITPGDELFDDMGNVCRVTAVSGINNRPCFRLVFDDGSEIIADDVHRWLTFTGLFSDFSVKSTDEIASSVFAPGGDLYHAIRMPTGRMLRISSCEPVPSVPTKCIAVDSPSRLFLAGRSMIPTHNSDLLIGAATTQHRESLIFRRQYTQLRTLEKRLLEIYPDRAAYNMQRREWKARGRVLTLGACNKIGDEQAFQGHATDLKGFDELTHFAQVQYTFLCGWLRSADPRQRTRILSAGNPPLDASQFWVVDRFAPWLAENHPNPAAPGELRYFTTIDGQDIEVDSGAPFWHKGERVEPRSRTFIPSSIEDNPYYIRSGYKAVLQALPEPLRSAMLHGNFRGLQTDDAYQLIPTAWVEAAQARWKARPRPDGPRNTIGIDVARGGRDKTIFAPRAKNYVDELVAHPGRDTIDGPHVAALLLPLVKNDDVQLNVDYNGVGAAVFDALNQVEGLEHVNAIDVGCATDETDRSGKFGFGNVRAWLAWKLREALDPDLGDDMALPPDPELKADLTAPR